MTVLHHRPALRWGVPVVAAAALAVGGSAVGVISATARGGLPDRSAARLLVDVQKAKVDGLSGTIVQNADLGLPSLPGMGGSGSSDLTSMVAGSHTLRVWYAGPDRVRLALQGSLGESDVIRRGTDLWTWSSSTRSATHHKVPLSGDHGPRTLASASPLTPQQAADMALKALSPTTKVTTDGTAVVAGRSAYELLLRPRTSQSLISSVRIAIDGRTHVPTRVQVFGRNTGKPALEVGFTAVSFAAPDAAMFRFNPPPGTKVSDDTSPSATGKQPSAMGGLPMAKGSRPHVVGKGWTSVVVAKVPRDMGAGSRAGARSGQDSLPRLLNALPRVHGAWGAGHLLRGTLFSVVLTDDGRVALGAVPPERLYAALAGS